MKTFTFATLALAGLAAALPGNTPTGYETTTTTKSSTTPAGPGGYGSTTTKSSTTPAGPGGYGSSTTSSCSTSTSVVKSTGKTTYTTWKVTTVYVPTTASSPYTTEVVTTVPTTIVITRDDIETVTAPVTRETTYEETYITKVPTAVVEYSTSWSTYVVTTSSKVKIPYTVTKNQNKPVTTTKTSDIVEQTTYVTTVHGDAETTTSDIVKTETSIGYSLSTGSSAHVSSSPCPVTSKVVSSYTTTVTKCANGPKTY